jgi:hypothetical protein
MIETELFTRANQNTKCTRFKDSLAASELCVLHVRGAEFVHNSQQFCKMNFFESPRRRTTIASLELFVTRGSSEVCS